VASAGSAAPPDAASHAGIVGGSSSGDTRARLTRLVNRAPEVMVKVTGRTRDPGGLRAHLDYISRNGQLELEDRDGAILTGRAEVKELADDWSAVTLTDRRRRANSPISLSVMLGVADEGSVVLRTHEMGASLEGAWGVDDDEVTLTMPADQVARLALAPAAEVLKGGDNALARLSKICEAHDVSCRVASWT
jgi:hypothetical protein